MEPSGDLKYRGRSLDLDDTSSTGSPRSASPPAGESFQIRPTAGLTKGKSLAERSKVPPSFAITFGTILGLQYASGMWSATTVEGWLSSVRAASARLAETIQYPMDLFTLRRYENATMWDYGQTLVVSAFSAFLFYIFFLAPAMHGLWTGRGRKAGRAAFHRYAGLSYLIHYVLAGVELATNYGDTGKSSYLTHIVAVTGVYHPARNLPTAPLTLLLQVSFKELPPSSPLRCYQSLLILATIRTRPYCRVALCMRTSFSL